MIWRVVTRWNMTSMVIDRGLYLKPALDALCILSTHNKGVAPTKRLKRFRLRDIEWQILEQLNPILAVSPDFYQNHFRLKFCRIS